MLVILEDDCLPSPQFFQFVSILLKKYKNSNRVALISGAKFNELEFKTSYIFSNFAHVWGWATWRNEWENYSLNVERWEYFKKTENFKNIIIGKSQINFWDQVFNKIKNNKLDTWDYQLNLMLWLNNRVSIIPTKNLIKNIGFGLDATHTKRFTNDSNRNLEEITFPLTHPVLIQVERDNELYSSKYIFNSRLVYKIINILKYLLNEKK